MSVSYLKQIKDHPETWEFINQVNNNKLVKNPEFIAGTMLYKKDKNVLPEKKDSI
jgi:hypothetical protein